MLENNLPKICGLCCTDHSKKMDKSGEISEVNFISFVASCNLFWTHVRIPICCSVWKQGFGRFLTRVGVSMSVSVGSTLPIQIPFKVV